MVLKIVLLLLMKKSRGNTVVQKPSDVLVPEGQQKRVRQIKPKHPNLMSQVNVLLYSAAPPTFSMQA